jgi:hypothetical protein
MPRTENTLRRPKIIAPILIIVGVCVHLDRGSSQWSEVRYDLTVRVLNEGKPIRWTVCRSFERREDAQHAVREHRNRHSFPPGPSMIFGEFKPFTGASLTVRISASRVRTRSGRELSRSQDRYLAFVAELQDGERVGKVVDIPDERESKEMTVMVP